MVVNWSETRSNVLLIDRNPSLHPGGTAVAAGVGRGRVVAKLFGGVVFKIHYVYFSQFVYVLVNVLC